MQVFFDALDKHVAQKISRKDLMTSFLAQMYKSRESHVYLFEVVPGDAGRIVYMKVKDNCDLDIEDHWRDLKPKYENDGGKARDRFTK